MNIEGNPIILKASYNETKIKFQVADDSQTIQQLKELICLKFGEQGVGLEADKIDCLDEDDFKMCVTDKISAILKDNHLVKVIIKQPDHIVQQDMNKQDPKQQQPQQQQQQQQKEEVQPQEIEIVDPVEAIVVLFDVSGSMGSPFFSDNDLPRIGAVNAFFSAFADKTLAFEFNHIVKLVCFQTSIVDKCKFTNDFNQFIRLVDGCNAGGGTKCYDAIAYAIEQLLEVKIKYPNIILRILALTDGEDNQSKSKPQDLVQSIIQNKIIIDSFVVSQNCTGLKTLTHASGGRCYCPQEITQGLQLFELETILSVSQREKVPEITIDNVNLNDLQDRPFDTDGMKAAQPKAATESAMKREDIIKQYQASQQANQASGTNQSSSGGALKRIYKELNDNLQAGNAQVFKIFPTSDIFSWRIMFIGPVNSVYENGVFILTCQLPQNYPFKPPKINFVNKIYHCNISSQGALCLDILRDSWSPALTIQAVTLSIHSLLTNPNPDDSLDSTIASIYKMDKNKFEENARACTATNANFTIEELTIQALGVGCDVESEEYKNTKAELELWIDLNKKK